MLTTILIAALGITASPDFAPGPGATRRPADPYIEVWMNENEVFQRGDRARVYFRTDVDAFVTIFRIDTDGRVRVLFPIDPWDDNFARGGTRYEVDARHGGYAFRVDDYPGEGYVFAVASADPFAYNAYVRGDHWDYRAIGYEGRITGDPYVAFGDILAAIVPPNYVAYSYDVAPYFVERQYAYPRFVCYDCHTYAAYPYWNPYHSSCFKFRLVIYDDPYYYPARVYVGTRVVYRRRTVTVPRYVFKDRAPNDDHVVTVRERPLDDQGRRRIAPGVRGRDLGGIGRVPAPVRRDVTAPSDPVRRRVEMGAPGQDPRRVTPDRRTIDQGNPRLERRVPPPTTERGGNGTEPRRVTPPGRDSGADRRSAGTPDRATPDRAVPQRRGGVERSPVREPSRVTPPQRGGGVERAPARAPSRASPQRGTPNRATPQRTPSRATPQRSAPPRKAAPPPKRRKTD